MFVYLFLNLKKRSRRTLNAHVEKLIGMAPNVYQTFKTYKTGLVERLVISGYSTPSTDSVEK